MNQELSGKIALVTGASRGLGRAIAIKLSSAGAKVAVNYLNNDAEASTVSGMIEKQGGQVMLVKANVAESEAVKNMVRQITE
jgi:3-oxoacyl-[acyl-carrier protein] reductase